jgi:hypothetical protein
MFRSKAATRDALIWRIARHRHSLDFYDVVACPLAGQGRWAMSAHPDVTVRRLQRGEMTGIEAIDALLAEELTLRENRHIKIARMMAPLHDQDACRFPTFTSSPRSTRTALWRSLS